MRDGPLIVGLGNPFNGDAGVGLRILELLATDERLPQDTELMAATPEFVQQRDYLKGRTEVILLDATSGGERGAVEVLEDEPFRSLDPTGDAAGRPHSARHALDLLEQAESEILNARFTVVGVAIGPATSELRPGLSDVVEAGARAAVETVLARLNR